MRAAVLVGPGALEVRDIPDPEGEVLIEVHAATACGTDVKMLRRGHPLLGDYPCRFGHEMAGVRLDTGEPVLVGDSVACGACATCEAGRAQLCREMTWVLGGFAERIAAPEAALHTVPPTLDLRVAAVAEPLAACVHAVSRGTDALDCGVIGGGTMGLMLTQLLVQDGRQVTLADPHPERRAQAESYGARAVEHLGRHDLVFEAVGRPRRGPTRSPPRRRAAVWCWSAVAPGVRPQRCRPGRCTTTSSTSAERSITIGPRWTGRCGCCSAATSTSSDCSRRRSASTSCRAP